MDHDRYIGRLLDNRYEILEVIGTGGMAVVYKARCHRLNRLVAIKILKDEYSQDEEFRRRFHAEGQAVAMLSHPNIVQVYDVSSSDNADFIVMELIDGITLKQYMEKKGVLNWKETLHFAMQIGKALEHAHSRGIVHRDIKPHNVMVLKNGSVKVTDFGIARVVSKSNTLTKEALGSVHYISPEQAKGGRVDNRSDLYSLGVVMYEMMTGRPPYDGESPVAVAIQHINGGAVMPSTLNPNIPGGLEQIIMKVMALDPRDRYPSATAMLYDMDEFRKNPAMLFDFGNTPVDDATRILGTAAAAQAGSPQRRTTAERMAGTGSEPPRRRNSQQHSGSGSSQVSRKRLADPEREEKNSRAATIAIVACSVVAVIAIIIFMALLLNGGFLNQNKDLVDVPNLVGQYYEQVKDNEDFEIVLQSSRYDEEAEEGKILEQTPTAEEGKKERGIKIFVVVSMGKEPEVPVMEDWASQMLDAAQVKAYLDGQGYYVMVRDEANDQVEKGYIIRTEPEAGTELTPGQKIILVVSTGPEIKTAKVPNVVGSDLENAVKILYGNGFKNLRYEEVESSKPKGEVVRQSINKNEEVDVTTEIVLEISLGPVETTVPPTTQPEVTDPELVTKKITIMLPTGMTEPYELALRQGEVDILDPVTIDDVTQTELIVELTGFDIQRYQLYVNDEPYGDPIYVDFTIQG